jgi:hypothetical protein
MAKQSGATPAVRPAARRRNARETPIIDILLNEARPIAPGGARTIASTTAPLKCRLAIDSMPPDMDERRHGDVMTLHYQNHSSPAFPVEGGPVAS